MSDIAVQQVYKLHRRFVDEITSVGMTAFLRHLDVSVKFYPPGEPTVEGLEAAERWCRDADKLMAVESVEAADEEYIHTGDHVVECGRFTWKVKNLQVQGESTEARARFVAVWKQQPDGGLEDRPGYVE